jgi:hypothetical protein
VSAVAQTDLASENPVTSLPTSIAALTRRLARFFREQAARETQALLNHQLSALHVPRGIMRPGHLCAPAWATAGAGVADDPLEQLWRLPAHRPRRRIR